MSTMHRARGILDIVRDNTGSVTGRAKSMNTGMGNHTNVFSSPFVPLAQLANQVILVDNAEIVAATRAKGSAQLRNVQRNLLVGMMETQLTYIQQCADKAATPEEAASILLLGGVKVAGVGHYYKQILTVKQGPQPGTVLLYAFARLLRNGEQGSVFFNWQSTSDGKTLVNLPSTPKSKTSVANLTPLQSYGFRVSCTMPDGIPGEWSQIVNFLVH